MWAFARFDIGLSNSEFWQLTPKLYSDLVCRWEREQMALDYRSAVIAATVAQVNGAKCKVEDFMLHKPPRPAMTDEDMFRAVESLQATIEKSAEK